MVQVDVARPDTDTDNHADAPPAHTRTVLEWLREDAHCTGTKEGCAEGDCGACTVVLGELDAAGALQLKPVNSCIQFLPTLDGKALFTVEDLAPPDGELHPVQQSLVACHGSQCGFCTPGFVMSLWACYQRHAAAGTVPSRQQLADDLSGNLCRCTGYRPILDAGQLMFALPPKLLQTAAVVQALRELQSLPPLHTASGFFAPRSLDVFAALRRERPQALVLAGSTDMGLWVTKQFRDLPELISINEVQDLKTVVNTGTHLNIGAAASLEDAWLALVAVWPALRDVWLRFASPPIRRAGTMGGNIANGSPIGDSAPTLIALDTLIVLRLGDQLRRLPLQDFYLGYMKNALLPGEFVQALEVPLPPPLLNPGQPAAQLQVYKISKRFDCDISALCAALRITLDGAVAGDPAGARISAARIVFGGMAATVCRAPRTEAALVGQPWTEATLQAAQSALAQDYTPLSDMRASQHYRLQVAQNLLRRFWYQTRPGAALSEAEVSVFARAA